MTGVLRVAVPSPLYQLFDYLPPTGDDGPFRAGMRVRVPFGRGRVVGVIVATAVKSEYPAEKLKRAAARLDDTPVLPADMLKLAAWAADYYHHPIGEVLATMLPSALRAGAEAKVQTREYWRITTAGMAVDLNELKRARRQAALLTRLRTAGEDGLARTALDDEGSALAALRGLAEKGLVARIEKNRGAEAPLPPVSGEPPRSATQHLQLNDDQAAAVDAIADADGYRAFLLDGITGSGKTEVYLRAIDRVVAAGRQALVLVPEIALTPQLVGRFRERFDVPLAVLHSALNDTERLDAWLRAARGVAPIVIGTRSAVFTPLARPGLVVVDEEHDPSFKQHEGFRYSARDLAVWRAHEAAVPVVLGSATPSLESLHNVRSGRYTALHLPERAGAATHPSMRLLDVRGGVLREGLSDALLRLMEKHLAAGSQVLLFLNRRGYAPVLQCHDCGWLSECSRCDARMTLHRRDARLRCHHCGHEAPAPRRCPACGSEGVMPIGLGTERIERVIGEDFADCSMVRIDRDATRRKGELDRLLARAEGGDARILVGTQMLAKGHHFPLVTLVAVVDADGGLFSADFRASERMAQLILQVAGRAGRADRPGEVVIQTHCPDHPLLQSLVARGYPAFADAALKEREVTGLPPYGHLALLRAEATDEASPDSFLEAAGELAREAGLDGVDWLGPVPAPMARRAGRYRAQVLLRADARTPLQRLLATLVPQLGSLREARRVRWSVDVDPSDTF
ncbi:MAG: primosomal protein N' [Gammaproteobacteria bacterium]